jgi:lipopolysaccharide export system permease protein
VLRPRERLTGDLLHPDPNDALFQSSPGRLTSELHDRFANPFYAPAFILLVLAFMGHAQTTRTNRMQAVVAAFSIATICRILGIGAANAAVVRPAASPLLYAVPLGAGLLAAVATQWHTYPRKTSRLERALVTKLERVKSGLADLITRRSRRAPSRRLSKQRA